LDIRLSIVYLQLVVVILGMQAHRAIPAVQIRVPAVGAGHSAVAVSIVVSVGNTSTTPRSVIVPVSVPRA